MHLNCNRCSFAALALTADVLYLVVMPLFLLGRKEYRGLQKAFCWVLDSHAGVTEDMHMQMTSTTCRAASVHV